MKFILNEDKKFILNERFILNEANEDDLLQLLQQNLEVEEKEEKEVSNNNSVTNTKLKKVSDEDGRLIDILSKETDFTWDIYYKKYKKGAFWKGRDYLPEKKPTETEDYSECSKLSDDWYRAFKYGYWKAEWGDKAELMSKVGELEVFTQGITVFGFNLKINPLLNFFKQKYFEIIGSAVSVDKIKSNYIAFHNLLANRVLEKADLFAPENLLLIADIYNLTSKELVELIELQEDTLDRLEKHTALSDKDAEVAWMTMSTKNGKLLDLKTIEAAIVDQLGFESSKPKVADDSIIEQIISRVSSTEEAQQLLIYFRDRYRAESISVLDRVNTNTKSQLYSLINNIDFTRVLELDKGYNYKFNNTQLEKLLTELAKKAGII